MTEWRPIDTNPREEGVRISIYVPLEAPLPRRMTPDDLYTGEHTARWYAKQRQWIVGGEIWMDEAFHIDEHIPTHWKPLGPPPETDT